MGDENNNQGDYYYNDLNSYSLCPSWAPLLGFGGCAAAVCLASKLNDSCCFCIRVKNNPSLRI